MCAVSGSPLTRGVNRSHVLYGSLRRTRVSCPPVAASRAGRARTSRREVADGPERDAIRGCEKDLGVEIIDQATLQKMLRQ